MPELRQVCAWFAQDFESCRGVWGLGAGESGGMLVEEYIDGSEVDVDCVVERCVCVCARPFIARECALLNQGGHWCMRRVSTSHSALIVARPCFSRVI